MSTYDKTHDIKQKRAQRRTGGTHLSFLLHAGHHALDGLLEVFEYDAVVEVSCGD